MHVEVYVPDEYMGDVMGDMNKRRGRIMGMNQVDGMQQLVAEAPQAEMFKYATDLRSMTQARGWFTMSFERYEEVPCQRGPEDHRKRKAGRGRGGIIPAVSHLFGTDARIASVPLCYQLMHHKEAAR